jgi:hypothetical protein
MSANPACAEVLDFLVSGIAPESLIAFRPSAAAQARTADLIERNESGTLTPEERQELADTLQLEHLIILAKARARP